MAKQLQIWLDRGAGSAFESKLYAALPNIEFERRDATTYCRRQQTPWTIYAFIFEDHNELQAPMLIAKEIGERYHKEIRYHEYILQIHRDPAKFRGRRPGRPRSSTAPGAASSGTDA